MRSKMGTVVPKMGTTVHLAADQARYREAVAAALRAELGPTHQAIKTAMRWTGASERTVKYWLSGERGPSGEHLILLAQHSDAVLLTILTMAERMSDERHRCPGCPERLLVLQNLRQEPNLSEDF
ncbi:MAG: XRE family transcriptional regulator [Tabrizicola sp.]|uniref:XRE family transcriptional regulator n=1 Tax=Tabrizicola sp. TaxID=2005166 RepID=UPI00273531B2|nr:XRE family transcriptional regulator [Tabrizicola sp.]MDP3264478.1 XRE family transcriptional regulator [Tabrizicola sp.]MDZ4070144.1 XRE family transcriptional regulator [Tabrizicola sp.]